MAIYHLSAKVISRSAGRSSTAAAAYRAGEKIVDSKTGEIHDYAKKSGVIDTELVLPNGQKANRAEFWNRVELHHKRGDAVVAREIEVALPAEVSPEERKRLAIQFATQIANWYGVAADVAIHAPNGKNKNYHAHILLSACHVLPNGELGKKAVELDPMHCGKNGLKNAADRLRPVWEKMINASLVVHAVDAELVSHKSHAARGLKEMPGKHLGPVASAIERKTGRPSRLRIQRQERADALLDHQLEATRAKLAKLAEERKARKAVEVRDTAIKPEQPKPPTIEELKQLQLQAQTDKDRKEWLRLDNEIRARNRQPGKSGIER